MANEILNDRELLEMAAKAAGLEVQDPETGAYSMWNPLRDDGDALRLAVKMNITICRPVSGDNVVHWGTYAMPEDQSDGPKVLDGNDPYAATRRAIVRAAAIGAAK